MNEGPSAPSSQVNPLAVAVNARAPLGPEAREKLIGVASAQRALIWGLLAGVTVHLAAGIFWQYPIYTTIAYGVTATINAYLTYRLASVLPHCGIPTLLALATFLPFISVLVMGYLNSHANSVITQAGFKVGFLGADPSQFGDLSATLPNSPTDSRPSI